MPEPPSFYWWPPTLMLLTFLFGIVFSVALNLYYHRLRGKEAASLSEQQAALFLGTTFAYLAQVSLAFSVRIASVQWMWRSFKRESFTFGAIDAGFAALNDPFSFLNWELWKKSFIGTILALLSW